MAGKQDISTALKRQLRSGKEYEKLMPAVKCESTPLGEGDTFFTVDQMRAWVEKYRWQTAKLALVLEGQSLQETIANIYKFLYDHVQYTADGALQQLRSPACTWLQRKNGTDCKSFSVFASSILSNLGIKHAIRQVRQPYFYPEEFTHVYVVVYQDQNKETYSENAPTFVIDATRHQNTEVEFIEKADIPMQKLQHVGLNAPQDERAARVIANFNKFCDHLIENGVPVAQVNAIRQEVNKYTSKGRDPKFRFHKDGISINGKLFVLKFKNEEGLGFVATGTALTAGKKLMDMLPADFVGDTFLAVFANGMDFSCWNAASSPQESQGIITESIQPYFEQISQRLSNPSGNDDLMRNLNLALEGSHKLAALYRDMTKNTSWAKCTIKGHEVIAKFAEGIRDHFLSVLNSPAFSFSKKTVNGNAVFAFNDFKIGIGGAANFPVSYPQVTAITQKGSYTPQKPTTPTTGNDYSNDYTNNYQPTGSNNGGSTDGNGGSTAKKSSNTGIIIGGITLAAMPFLLPMMKKGATDKPASKPAKKAKK
ncbi:hypothetical protein RM549_06175 [Salegentibacter sp. F188]|uniref:Transglutaminase-like domain-containing protein n=1 Tax=Autumnicola patrickiae TaxID=3075591 RepID=A0ABU3E039_9FLAO|nr:hypothetical protein [Salegentibacter sp. F188]MDT0689364.1 hypothetical protein [Salegentibacter sp. F188]